MDVVERAAAQSPPPGFRVVLGTDGLITEVGPVFARPNPDGTVVMGCRIMPAMCNPLGGAHGGWLATLCDVVLPLTARATVPDYADTVLLTVSLSIDYMRAPQLGDWVDCTARVLRRTRRMVFMDCMLSVDGDPAVRGSGVFRTGPGGARFVLGDCPGGELADPAVGA